MGVGAGGSPGITHLVDWRQGVYAAVVVIVSASWGGSDGAKSHDPKQEDGLCSNSCYDTQPRTLSLWETGAACEVVIFESLFLFFLSRELALFFIIVFLNVIFTKCHTKAEQVESGPENGCFLKWIC